MDMQLYKKVFAIRVAEELIIRDYHFDQMKTPMHMSWGEESLVCAVESSLPIGSLVATTYRSHALYLARTSDFYGFFCEMFGKVGGCADGRAGSMHLGAHQVGMLSSSAIVGGNISVAVGASFGLSRQMNNIRRVAVFFGDGATDAGTFWESLNLAKLYNTPTIFVCADNKLAVHSSNAERRGWNFDNLEKIVGGFEIPYLKVSSACVFTLAEEIKAFFASHSPTGPLFLHGEWYRFLEHVGINEDFSAGYRVKPSDGYLQEWDPVARSKESLLRNGCTASSITSLETEVIEEAQAALELAKESDFASASTIYNNVLG